MDPRRPPRTLEPRGPPRLGPHHAGPPPTPSGAGRPPRRRPRAGLCRRKKSPGPRKRRLETAQEKAEAVRQCARAIDEAVHDYRGARVPLSSWLESEAPKALAVLRRMMDNLDRYVALQAPSGTMTGSPLASPASRIEEEAQTRGPSASVPSTEYSVPSTDADKTEANEQAPSALSTENSVLSTGDAGARSTGFSRNPTNVPPEGSTANRGGPACDSGT